MPQKDNKQHEPHEKLVMIRGSPEELTDPARIILVIRLVAHVITNLVISLIR